MILSSMELLYLAAYWILVYEYVVMRHEFICEESDTRINAVYDYCIDTSRLFSEEWTTALYAQNLYWIRGY